MHFSKLVLVGSIFTLSACAGSPAPAVDDQGVRDSKSALTAEEEPAVETVSQDAIDSGEVQEVGEEGDTAELGLSPRALRPAANAPTGAFSIPASLCRNGCIIFLTVLQDVSGPRGTRVAPVMMPSAPRMVAPATRPVRARVAASPALQQARYRIVLIVIPLNGFSTAGALAGNADAHPRTPFLHPLADPVTGVEEQDQLLDKDFDAATDTSDLTDVEEE
jgi:hypothetical protein